MAQRDVEVWERWLDRYAADYTAVSYDVAVGGLAAPDESGHPNDLRAWQYQTALKIDALILAADRALVAEVRPWATVSALGAALTYAMVLERAGLSDQLLVPTIICQGMQTDVRWACDKLGVVVFEV